MSAATRSSLYIAESRIKGAGNGLFTRRGIKKGAVCVVFTGQACEEADYIKAERELVRPEAWSISYWPGGGGVSRWHEVFLLDHSLTLTGVQRGSASNWYWMNKSSTPNTEIVLLLSENKYVWKAKKDIAASEELTWVYNGTMKKE